MSLTSYIPQEHEASYDEPALTTHTSTFTGLSRILDTARAHRSSEEDHNLTQSDSEDPLAPAPTGAQLFQSELCKLENRKLQQTDEYTQAFSLQKYSMDSSQNVIAENDEYDIDVAEQSEESFSDQGNLTRRLSLAEMQRLAIYETPRAHDPQYLELRGREQVPHWPATF